MTHMVYSHEFLALEQRNTHVVSFSLYSPIKYPPAILSLIFASKLSNGDLDGWCAWSLDANSGKSFESNSNAPVDVFKSKLFAALMLIVVVGKKSGSQPLPIKPWLFAS